MSLPKKISWDEMIFHTQKLHSHHLQSFFLESCVCKHFNGNKSIDPLQACVIPKIEKDEDQALPCFEKLINIDEYDYYRCFRPPSELGHTSITRSIWRRCGYCKSEVKKKRRER